MQSPTFAEPSASANVSEFARAELEAFVSLNRRQRPAAWARIEQLQQLCRRESPSTPLGRARSTHLMDDLLFSRGPLSIEAG